MKASFEGMTVFKRDA